MRVRSGSQVPDGEELPLATAAYAQAVAAREPIGASSDTGQQRSLFNGPDQTFSFGPFRLIPARHLVLRNGAPLRLGSRALAILGALVERRGELVTRDELIATGWPRLFVHESNLKVNMANLRRSLGDTPKEPIYIATVIGRGYRFVAPVELGVAGLRTEQHVTIADT
jgi:DNA-binding winged helix-turn-helix (wHTH) protein